MGKIEEIFLHVTVIITALFANKFVTYEFSVPKYAVLTTMVLILSIGLIFRWWKEKQLKLYFSFSHLFWFLFSLSSILSTISVYRYNRFYFRYSIDIALFVVLSVLISLYISNRFKSKEPITRLFLTFIATGVVVAIDAILNFYTGRSIFLGVVGEPFSRAAIKSTIGNTIFVANYMTMLLVSCLYFLLSDNYGWKNLSRKGFLFVKIFSMVAFWLFLTTVVISQTRSEYISMIFSVAVFAILYFVYSRKTKTDDDVHNWKNLKKLLITILIFGVAVIMVIYNTDNPLTGGGKVSVTSRFSAMTSVSSIDERLLAWLGAIYQWKENKLIGTGIGTYQIKAIDILQDVMKDRPELLYGWNNFKRTHNDYLQVLGETGIFGLISVLLLMLSLIIYAFKYLKTVERKDDLLLFLTIACGFIAFMVQSFFSFPGHLLPNSLLALFLASTAVGTYFNGRRFLAIDIEVGRSKLAIFSIFVLLITISSTFLKWNYFISEVYFKNGNSNYSALLSVTSEKSRLQQYEQFYLQKLEKLENLTGEFSYLRAENYKSNLSGIEAEKQRINQIASIKNNLTKNLSAIQNNLKTLDRLEISYSEKAQKNLTTALRINHTYGKAHFYLASLCLRPLRIEKLESALKSGDFSPLRQEYDDFQSAIANQYKASDLLFLSELLEKRQDLISAGDVASLQAILDSCALFKTSLLSFNERNTYKALASRYQSLFSKIDRLIDQLKSYSDDILIGKTLKNLQNIRDLYLTEFVKYAKMTVDRLPGGWNRFPDWKNVDLAKAISGEDIYRLLATLAASSAEVTDETILSLLEYLAEKEAQACEGMASKNVWGVPDGASEFLLIAAEKFEDFDPERAKQIYRKMLEIYTPAYERISKHIESLDIGKAVSEYMDKISSNLSIALIEKGMDVEKVEIVEKIVEDYVQQIQSYLKNINWKDIINNELDVAIKENNWNEKFVLSRNIANVLSGELQKLISSVTSDDNTAIQVFQKISSSVSSLPYSILLWERESRFIAFYSILSSKQSDYAIRR
jgi:O-antigen ligase